jgi:hypothetical protein
MKSNKEYEVTRDQSLKSNKEYEVTRDQSHWRPVELFPAEDPTYMNRMTRALVLVWGPLADLP